MRQNHDYVTMNDYASDMREQSAMASNVISHLRARIDDLEREKRYAEILFWNAVEAAGGKIEIRELTFRGLPRGDLIKECNDYNGKITFRIKQDAKN